MVASPGGRLPLTRELIIEQAIELIDSEGIDALSMRSLGRALGVEAMSLYTHIGNRQQLLTEVLDHTVQEMSADPSMLLLPGDDWQAYLRRVAHGVRKMVLVHPKILPLMISQPPAAPWVRPPLRSLVWIEAFISGLREKGLDKVEAVRIYRSFTGFLLGHLLLEVSSGGVGLVPAVEVGDGAAYGGGAGAGLAGADADEPAMKPDLRSYPNLLEMAPLLAHVDFEGDFRSALDDHIASLIKHL